MDIVFLIILFSLIALGVVLTGVIRNRNFSRKEKLHQQFSQKNDLQLAYIHERQFNMYGNYRGYPVLIESFSVALPTNKKNVLSAVRFSIPVTNPMRKCIKAEKGFDLYPHLALLAPLDKGISVKHGMGDDITMATNDMLFSSRVLSEEVRISIYDAFKDQEAGILYLQDENLSFATPRLLVQEDCLPSWQKMLDLLCDIKDELN